VCEVDDASSLLGPASSKDLGGMQQNVEDSTSLSAGRKRERRGKSSVTNRMLDDRDAQLESMMLLPYWVQPAVRT
jgi:hypothetical protein